jgi:hypothetical protein
VEAHSRTKLHGFGTEWCLPVFSTRSITLVCRSGRCPVNLTLGQLLAIHATGQIKICFVITYLLGRLGHENGVSGISAVPSIFWNS